MPSDTIEENPFERLVPIQSGPDTLDENPFEKLVPLRPKRSVFEHRIPRAIPEDLPEPETAQQFQMRMLRNKEASWTPEKAVLGAALGVSEGLEHAKVAAGGLLGGLFTPGPAVSPENAEKMRATGARIEEAIAGPARKEAKKLDELSKELSPGLGTQIPRMLASGAVSTLPSLAAAPFLGLPGAALVASAQSFGSTYDKAVEAYKAKGLPESDARAKAVLPAVGSALVTGAAVRTFGGIERLFSKLGKGQLAKESVNGLVKEVAKSAGLEIPEEFVNQLGEGMIEQKTYNPDKSWEDIWKESFIAAGLGGTLGLIMGGGVVSTDASIRSVRDALGRRAQRRADRKAEEDAARNLADFEVAQQKSIRDSIVDEIMKVGERQQAAPVVPPPERIDAQQDRTATPVYGDVQQPGGPPEGAGQVPTPVSSPGILPSGPTPVQTPPPVVPAPEAVVPVPAPVVPLPEPVVPSSPPVVPVPEQPVPVEPAVVPTKGVAKFGGYMGDGQLAIFNIPGVGGRERSVSRETAIAQGYTIPEVPTFEQWQKSQAKAAKAAKEPKAREPGKVQIGTSPQLYTVVEELPPVPGDLPGERYFKVRNDRTGEVTTVEKAAIRGEVPSSASPSSPTASMVSIGTQTESVGTMHSLFVRGGQFVIETRNTRDGRLINSEEFNLKQEAVNKLELYKDLGGGVEDLTSKTTVNAVESFLQSPDEFADKDYVHGKPQSEVAARIVASRLRKRGAVSVRVVPAGEKRYEVHYKYAPEEAKKEHIGWLEAAMNNNRPVSAKAIDQYGITPKEGYVRQGDQFVFNEGGDLSERNERQEGRQETQVGAVQPEPVSPAKAKRQAKRRERAQAAAEPVPEAPPPAPTPAPVAAPEPEATTPAKPEIEQLLDRRAAILKQIAADPVVNHSADVLEELVKVSNQIHELQPWRGESRGSPSAVPETPPTPPEGISAPKRATVEVEGTVGDGKLFDSALDEVEGSLASLGVAKVRVADNLDNAGLGGFAQRAVATVIDGEVVVNGPLMLAELGRFKSAKQRRAFLQQVLIEEGIHDFIIRTLTQQEIEGVWNSLTEAQRIGLAESYSGGANTTQLTPYQLGHEFLRQFLQIRLFGTRTESVRADATIFDRITDQLLAVIDKIIAAFKRLGIKGQNEVLDTAIDKLEAARFNKFADRPTPEISTRPSPPPAALVTTSGRWHDELVASGLLSPTQRASIDFGVVVQNLAAVPPAIQTAFGGLPKEVRAHLPFIQSRIAAMRDAMASLGINAPPQGDLRAQVQNTPDPTLAPEVMFNTHENIFDLRLERLNMEDAISTLETQLENERRKGAAVPTGQTALNPTKDLLRKAILNEQNALIAQRTALIAQGADVSSLNAEIGNLTSWLSQPTVPFRVLQAMIDNKPLNYQKLGVNPQDGARIAQILNNYPQLAQEIAAIQSMVTIDPTIRAMEEELKQKNGALQFLDLIFADPKFRENDELATDAVGARAVVLRKKIAGEDEKIVGLEFDQPITGVKGTIRFEGTEKAHLENTAILTDVLNEMYRYIDPALTPDAEPYKVEAYKRQIYNIENIYMSGAWGPGAGKTRWTRGDPFNLFTFGGIMSTPETIVDRIGGLAAGLSQNRLQNFHNAQQIIETRYKNLFNSVNLLQDKAWKAHKKDGIQSLQQWIRMVSDPILASSQEMGSVRLQAGSTYRGITITALDMEAVEAQKKLVDAISRAGQSMDTEQAKQFDLKIQIGGRLPYERDPQHRGYLTMPRYRTPAAIEYAKRWATIQEDIDEKRITKAQARAAFIELLGGNATTQSFWDLVEGHMRGATRIPSYARMIGSEFKTEYAQMISDIDAGKGPRSVDAVIDQLFGSQNVAPEKMRSRDQMADIFIGEIGKALSSIGASKPRTVAENVPLSTIDITSADNFLTKPRGEQTLPPTLLSYSAADINQQNRVKSAIYEVLGQRWVESLDALQTELIRQKEEFRKRVEELTSAGKSPREALNLVKEQTAQEQVDGQNWFNYTEVNYHLRRVKRQLAYMQDYATGKRTFHDEDVSTATNMLRKVVIGPLLNTVGVVTRNRIGGTLRMMQIDYAMGRTIRLGALPTPARARLLTSPIKRGVGTALDVITLGAFKDFLFHRFFQSPKGQAIRRNLASHANYYGTLLTAIIERANTAAYRYQTMSDLGSASGAPFADQLKAYVYLFTQGGVPRAELESIPRKVLRAMESMVGIVENADIFLLAGGPRGAFARWADMSINAMTMRYALEVVQDLERNALRYLGTRNNLGAQPSSQTRLTPQELVGTSGATAKQAEYIRTLFRRAGVNLDKKMVDYFSAVQQAKANGTSIDDVDLLTRSEWNSVFVIFQNEINKGGFANRPQLLRASEFGRTFGALLGYGANLNVAFSTAFSKFSRAKGPAAALNIEGVSTVAAWIMLLTLTGGATEELVRLLVMLFYKEERQTPRLSQAETPLEAAQIAAKNSGPFVPAIAGVFNYFVDAVKPGSGIGGSGFQFLPVSYWNGLMDSVKEVVQTQSIGRPAVNFFRKWVPNTKMFINRLPYNEGYTEYYNVNRTLRAATPGDIEYIRASGGGGSTYRKSPTSDNVANVVNALAQPGGPDWEWAMRERELGIAEKAARGASDPEGSFDQAVLQKTPYRAVYGRMVTDADRERIESRMTEPQRARLRNVEGAFAGYAQRTRPLRRAVASTRPRRGRRAGTTVSLGVRPGRSFRRRGTGRSRFGLRARRRLRGVSLRSSLSRRRRRVRL